MKLKTNICITIIIIAMLSVTVLSGCSSGDSGDAGFQTVFCGLYMNTEAIDEYGDALSSDMPELTIDGIKPLFTPVTMGSVQNDIEAGIINDPMMAATGIVKFTAMIATDDVDIVISDLENAARSAASESFMPLEDILTDSELETYKDLLLDFDITEFDGDEAILTGEKTPVCGIKITGNESIKQIYGDQEVGIFIAANTSNLDLAKKVLLSY